MKSILISFLICVAASLPLCLSLAPVVQAQSFQVIHAFTGEQDGATPFAGLVFDGAGNFYGTTGWGGDPQGLYGAINGVAFKLKPSGANWLLTPIYSFEGGHDGTHPYGLLRAADGTLYGTAGGGLPGSGCGPGCGIFFQLVPSPTPPRTALPSWNKNTLYFYRSQGGGPFGDLTFDQSGNVYGVGGNSAYELTPSQGGWQEEVLYTWQQHVGGIFGLVFDTSGNLYGVTAEGGQYQSGSVFELSPSGSGWTEQTIYSFQDQSDGRGPLGTLLRDAAGNLYGTTSYGGTNGGGTVFELSPANGGWTFTTLYDLACQQVFCGGPENGRLLMDAAGDLYGTAWEDGAYGCGSVFRLTPSNGSWSYTDLHDFTCGSDGNAPNGSLVFDANGNIFGTTYAGGTNYQGNCGEGCGVVYEINMTNDSPSVSTERHSSALN